jgi:ribosomal protein L11 methyltransferase
MGMTQGITMGFIQLVIDVDSKSADRLSDIFMDLEALSATVTDQHEGTALEQPLFNEPGYEVQSLWDNSHLVVLYNSDTDIKYIVESATDLVKNLTMLLKLSTIRTGYV